MRVPRRFYAQTLVLGSVTPSTLTLFDGTELKVGDDPHDEWTLLEIAQRANIDAMLDTLLFGTGLTAIGLDGFVCRISPGEFMPIPSKIRQVRRAGK